MVCFSLRFRDFARPIGSDHCIPEPARSITCFAEDDDWSFLAESAEAAGVLGTPSNTFVRGPGRNDVTIHRGEAREVWEQIGNDNWGQQPFMNGYFNERYMLYFDRPLCKHVRSFVEFKKRFEFYRIGGPRPNRRKETRFFRQHSSKVGTGE